jgi:uncharacterized protein (TIGR04540 family)
MAYIHIIIKRGFPGGFFMEPILFQSANDAAKAVKTIIDEYWRQDITKEQARCSIKGNILANPKNRARIFRGENYTAVFENVLGKKRLAEFSSLLDS